jgi:hypothetical protein
MNPANMNCPKKQAGRPRSRVFEKLAIAQSSPQEKNELDLSPTKLIILLLRQNKLPFSWLGTNKL